jgi:hypothetical protein
LPYIFAAVHSVFATIIFGSAIANPQRGGYLPLAVFYADYPASLGIEWVTALIDNIFRANLLVDFVSYLILGSLWFYLLGVVIRFIFAKLQRL